MRKFIAVFFLLAGIALISASHARACNTQIGFPDSCDTLWRLRAQAGQYGPPHSGAWWMPPGQTVIHPRSGYHPQPQYRPAPQYGHHPRGGNVKVYRQGNRVIVVRTKHTRIVRTIVRGGPGNHTPEASLPSGFKWID